MNLIYAKKVPNHLKFKFKGVVGVNGTSVEEKFCFIPEFS
jgi:hypothetical protein